MVKTEAGEQNIFNITRPDQYRCQVHHFHSRVSRLYLRVFKGASDTPAFYLLFTDVGYMDCPITWTGADFAIAPADDCIQLLLQAGLIGRAILQYPNAYASITDHAKLYTATTTTETQVRLIASRATMLQQLPDDLR
jgi:hypothetical protein